MAPANSYPNLHLVSRESAADSGELTTFFKRNVPLFRRVPLVVLRELANDASYRHYLKGQYVCRTGDPAKEVWIVKRGRLCVNQCGWRGNQLSIEVMLRGDVSGLAALACDTYPGEVLATRETLLIAIPRRTMVREIERHPVLAREILYAYGQRLHYIETLLLLSREPVEKRLLAALLYLYHKFGFTLPLTRAEIGTMAGTTSETTMRVLKRLEDRGLLKRLRGKVLIRDLPRLRSELSAAPVR